MARSRTAAPAAQSEPQDAEIAEAEEGEVIDEYDPPAVAGALAVRERGTAIVARDEISVSDLLEQHAKIQEAMSVAMVDGHHYGTIPGVTKPTLLKPGAEKLLVLFRLSPHYTSEKIWHDDGHLTVSVVCALQHIPTGLVVSTGEGLCTTRESRYAYRQGGRTCPVCEAVATIKKSKFPPKSRDYDGASSNDPPGWYCFGKIGGCGANFAHDDDRIVGQQEIDRVPNPDLADTYNTVLKMADKRALVAAILNGTAASDVFTQDVEDAPRGAPPAEPEPVTWATLDPGAQLWPTAPRGWKEILDALTFVDAGVDWPEVVERIFDASYGVRKVADLGDHAQVAGRRLANLATYLQDVVMEQREFPPPSDEELVQAIGWAFGGIVVELPEPDPGALTAAQQELDAAAARAAGVADADEIPFGEEQAS